jgi:chromosome segregation ATPase
MLSDEQLREFYKEMSENDIRSLLNEKDRYQEKVSQSQQRIDTMIFEYNSCSKLINELRVKLKKEKQKHKDYKQKIKKKHRKQIINLYEEILIIKAQAYDQIAKIENSEKKITQFPNTS